MRLLYLFVLALFIAPLPVRAQGLGAAGDTLALDGLLRAVREANPSLRAARLEAEALGTRAAQVSALPDPMVGVTYQPLPILTARGAQRSQWRVEQPIPYPGKLALQGEIADLHADVAALEADAFAEELILEAKQAYFELYRVQQLGGLIAAFQDELRGFEEVAAARYEVGTGMQQAVLKAQLEKNNLAQRLLDLAQRRRTAAETLARLTGEPGGTRFFQTVQVAPPQISEVGADALLSLALAQRPEVAALEVAAERAARQVVLAEKGFLPDFGVNLTYFDISDTDMPPTATGRDALALGATVKVPLQRGRLRAQLEEAKLRQAEVEARREAIRTQIQTQIEDLRYALEQEAATLQLYRTTLLPQAESTVEATLAAYTTGSTGFLDLLDAERTRFTLRTGYEDTLARYLKTAAALERALGVPLSGDLETFTAQAALSTPAPTTQD